MNVITPMTIIANPIIIPILKNQILLVMLKFKQTKSKENIKKSKTFEKKEMKESQKERKQEINKERRKARKKGRRKERKKTEKIENILTADTISN